MVILLQISSAKLKLGYFSNPVFMEVVMLKYIFAYKKYKNYQKKILQFCCIVYHKKLPLLVFMTLALAYRVSNYDQKVTVSDNKLSIFSYYFNERIKSCFISF